MLLLLIDDNKSKDNGRRHVNEHGGHLMGRQITKDHVLIERKHMNLVTNIRSIRGADTNSAHFLAKIS